MSETALTHDDIIKGLNLWMDKYIADPRGFEAEFETVQRHLAEIDDGVTPTYGEVGLDLIRTLLADVRIAA